MSGTILTGLLDRKNGSPCAVCGEMHHIQDPCRRQAMASKITKLMEANSMIPGLLQHNKEATILAQQYREILKRVDESHGVLLEVFDSHGEIGKKMKEEYLEKLDKWVAADNEPTSQNTLDQQELFSPEVLTSIGTGTKNSTTPSPGEDLPPCS